MKMNSNHFTKAIKYYILYHAKSNRECMRLNYERLYIATKKTFTSNRNQMKICLWKEDQNNQMAGHYNLQGTNETDEKSCNSF